MYRIIPILYRTILKIIKIKIFTIFIFYTGCPILFLLVKYYLILLKVRKKCFRQKLYGLKEAIRWCH